MSADQAVERIHDRKALFSSLWIFVSLNYIFCDVLTSMESGVLKELLTGRLAGIQISQGFLLAAAVSLEIPFLMVVLSRVLKHKANRWANIIAGTIMAVYQVGSFFVGSPPTLHYLFFSAIEIAGDLLIVWLAWRWRRPVEVERAVPAGWSRP